MALHTHKVGLIGTGNVGMAGAFAMFGQGICSEMVLVDLDKKRAAAEALDLKHGQGYAGRIQVTAGDYPDLKGCQVIVITAGVAQKPGETRLDLLNNNAKVFRSIAAELDEHAPDARIVVASNPVDILTFMMEELSDRPNAWIMGTGTMLDTSRFRSLLGRHYHVDPRSVHGYILGEHGDSEFAAWSTLTIGGKSPVGRTVLNKPWDQAAMDELFVKVRDAAYEIIDGKGYTNWAIGLVIARLVQIILDDQRSVQPVTARLEDDYGVSGVALSVPAVVGGNGIQRIVHLELPDDEMTALQNSAEVMRKMLAKVDL